eukprot:Tbor_TRINITY_DN5865_c0_g3::TRINITY_DN5865_c0_g3_i2::g.6106::m.6106
MVTLKMQQKLRSVQRNIGRYRSGMSIVFPTITSQLHAKYILSISLVFFCISGILIYSTVRLIRDDYSDPLIQRHKDTSEDVISRSKPNPGSTIISDQLSPRGKVQEYAPRRETEVETSGLPFDVNIAPQRCPGSPRPRSFQPLTSFDFWGTTMNTSCPCPTSGLNNQIVMILGLLYCSLSQTPSPSSTPMMKGVPMVLAPPFNFKDITCSPTGGVEKASAKYKVGSTDYEYAWFRWSEIFNVNFNKIGLSNDRIAHDGVLKKRLDDVHVTQLNKLNRYSNIKIPLPHLCLRDEYTWSEHPWMKSPKCSTTVDSFYGSDVYWLVRAAMPINPWFYRLSKKFLERVGSDEDILEDNSRSKSDKQNSDNMYKQGDHHRRSPISGRILGIHVRRGDYRHFCKGIVGSSAVKKFRIPPFKWLKKINQQQKSNNNSATHKSDPQNLGSYVSDALPSVTTLSSTFMDSCAPEDNKVINHIRKVLHEHNGAAASRGASVSANTNNITSTEVSYITTLVVATNSNMFFKSLQMALSNEIVPDHGDTGKDNHHRDTAVSKKRLKVVRFENYYNEDNHRDSSYIDEEHIKTQTNTSRTNSKMNLLNEDLREVRWPSRQHPDGTTTAPSLTLTEISLLDITLLSLADIVILNRYSTFSQSVIDFRMLDKKTLKNWDIYWW